MLRLHLWLSTLAAALALLSACSPVDDPSLFPKFNAATAVKPPAKAATEYNPQRNLYWGDLHIHTSYLYGRLYQRRARHAG